MPTSPVSLQRALVGSPIRRPFIGCLTWLALLVLLGLTVLSHLILWVSEPAAAALIFIGTACLATIISLPALGLLWHLDRRERESIWLFGGTILWGALVSTGLAGLVNSLGSAALFGELRASQTTEEARDIAGLLSAALIAPPVEEMTKGLALLVLFWFLRAEFDNLRDGLIYGALVGLGFNIAETALYVMQGYSESGLAPLGVQLAARFVLLGFNGHLIFSALCGAGLGLARQTPRRWLQLLAAPVGYGLATVAHALANSVGLIAFSAFLTGLGAIPSQELHLLPVGIVWLAALLSDLLVDGWAYLLVLILVALSARWERAVIRLFLADEVGLAVTPTEYASIQRSLPLLGTHPVARAGGRLGQQVFQAQTELAFRKWHVRREGGDPMTDALVAAWRDDIARLRHIGRPQPL